MLRPRWDFDGSGWHVDKTLAEVLPEPVLVASPPKRARAPTAPMSDEERTQKLLASLADYLEGCGGSRTMIDGWTTKTEIRREGSTAGTSDSYYINPQGKRFRARTEIARFFGLEVAPRSSKPTA